ncbi:MAG: hypothetical protein KGQ59_09525 [Bdellovibrionales bacterium]|nr:hypothetical protein [Bdellovibrionales bacterium]
MIKWTLVIFSLALLVVVFGVGLPLEMKAGSVNVVGNRLHFYTQSRSLASIIGHSRAAYVSCGSKKICITPTDRDRFDANLPIIFEYCDSQEGAEANNCNNMVLTITTTTKSWIRAGIKL